VPDLWAVYLGGDLGGGRLGEDHEVVFVVADDPKAVRRQAKKKWRGAGRAHVDAIQRLDAIDGWRILLEPGGGETDETDLDPTYSR
jgi:hypothetical protein